MTGAEIIQHAIKDAVADVHAKAKTDGRAVCEEIDWQARARAFQLHQRHGIPDADAEKYAEAYGIAAKRVVSGLKDWN
jgi:hypothetical protein